MTDSRKPYVRYELDADITDKGIAFAAKKAINTFLKTHGFDGHVRDLEASSDSFHAVLEIYDNGKYDFNVAALYEHLEASGRLPSKGDIRPKIKIKPLNCEAALEIIPKNKDDIGYRKAIEDLNERLDTKDGEINKREDTIKSLNDILGERQTAIDESQRRIVILEQRAKEMLPEQYGSAKKALVDGYLRGALDDYFELSVEIHELEEANSLAAFKHLKGARIPFAAYVNARCGTAFSNDTELEQLIKSMTGVAEWQSTAEAKRLEEAKSQNDANQEILELAQKKSVSPEILETIKMQVKKSKPDLEQLARKVEEIKRDFKRDKELVDSLDSLYGDYKVYQGIIQSSEKRTERGIALPIMIELVKNSSEIALYMPYNDEKCALEKELNKIFTETASRYASADAKVPRRVCEDKHIKIIASMPNNLQGNSLFNITEYIGETIRKANIFKALGVTPKVTLFQESR